MIHWVDSDRVTARVGLMLGLGLGLGFLRVDLIWSNAIVVALWPNACLSRGYF